MWSNFAHGCLVGARFPGPDKSGGRALAVPANSVFQRISIQRSFHDVLPVGEGSQTQMFFFLHFVST